jgi:hypothetical protein
MLICFPLAQLLCCWPCGLEMYGEILRLRGEHVTAFIGLQFFRLVPTATASLLLYSPETCAMGTSATRVNKDLPAACGYQVLHQRSSRHQAQEGSSFLLLQVSCY